MRGGRRERRLPFAAAVYVERDPAPVGARWGCCRLGGGRGVACRLTLAFHGSSRTWVYPENSSQFEDLSAGAPVPMLVDPRDPRTAYTLIDVRAHTNTGFGIVAGLGAFFACLGVM